MREPAKPVCAAKTPTTAPVPKTTGIGAPSAPPPLLLPLLLLRTCGGRIARPRRLASATSRRPGSHIIEAACCDQRAGPDRKRQLGAGQQEERPRPRPRPFSQASCRLLSPKARRLLRCAAVPVRVEFRGQNRDFRAIFGTSDGTSSAFFKSTVGIPLEKYNTGLYSPGGARRPSRRPGPYCRGRGGRRGRRGSCLHCLTRSSSRTREGTLGALRALACHWRRSPPSRPARDGSGCWWGSHRGPRAAFSATAARPSSHGSTGSLGQVARSVDDGHRVPRRVP